MKNNRTILILLIVMFSVLSLGACSPKAESDIVNSATAWNDAVLKTVAAIDSVYANFICEAEEKRQKTIWKQTVYADGLKAKVDGSGELPSEMLDYPTIYVSVETNEYNLNDVYTYGSHGKSRLDFGFYDPRLHYGAGSHYLRAASDNSRKRFLDISVLKDHFDDFMENDGEYVLKQGTAAPYFGIPLDCNENIIKELRISFEDGYVKSLFLRSYYHHPLYSTETWTADFTQTFTFGTNNAVTIPAKQTKLSAPSNVQIVYQDGIPVLTWDPVENADWYYISGREDYTDVTKAPHYELESEYFTMFEENKTYELRIQAVGNRLFYQDSELSESVIYVKMPS